MTKEADNNNEVRNTHLDIRLTPEEKNYITTHAEECGMLPSAYARKVLMNTVPKKRMTDRERELLDNLSDSKSNLDRITRVLCKTTDDNRRRLFGNVTFMSEWIAAVDEFLRYLTRLREKIMQD